MVGADIALVADLVKQHKDARGGGEYKDRKRNCSKKITGNIQKSAIQQAG